MGTTHAKIKSEKHSGAMACSVVGLKLSTHENGGRGEDHNVARCQVIRCQVKLRSLDFMLPIKEEQLT